MTIDRERVERHLTPGVHVDPLAATLMAAMMESTAAAGNHLIDNLRMEAARLRAELAAVREQVNEVVSGPWVPTAYAVTEALYPSREAIMRQMSSKDADEWAAGA